MRIIPKNQREQFFNTVSRRIKSHTNELSYEERSVLAHTPVYMACIDVYQTGIIFPRGKAAARKNITDYEIYDVCMSLGSKIHEHICSHCISTQSEFDEIHHMLCTTFLDEMNEVRLKYGYEPLNYGQAQKMINMSIKYLTLYSDYEENAHLFKYCHMPIDRIVLKSLKNDFGFRNITSDISYKVGEEKQSWSNFSYDFYRELLNDIRSNINLNDHTYLELEYNIWGGTVSEFISNL